MAFLQSIFHALTARRLSQPDAAPGAGARAYYTGNPIKGMRVDDHSSLAHSAVWRAINVIANNLSSVPWNYYTEINGRRVRVTEGRVAEMHKSMVNPEMHETTFRQTLAAHAVSRGNGYAEIERFKGEPVNLWPLDPTFVNPARTESGRLVYDIRQPGGSNVVLPIENVFHWKGLAFDGLVGYSPLTLARKAIALGLSMEQHGISLFSNDATPGGIITVPDSIVFDQVNEEAFLTQWKEKHGNPSNKGNPVVLRDGMTWQSISISPENAQFLETRKFQVTDIGPRWFGVPAPLMGDNDKATFNNFEQMMTMYGIHTLVPWACAYESEVNWKLLGNRSKHYSKLNLNGLMRGDMAARGEFYTKMIRSAGMTPDTVARLEDEDIIDEGGDMRYISRDLMPLGAASTTDLNTNMANEARSAASSTTLAPVSTSALDDVWMDAIARIQRKEGNALRRAKEKASRIPESWGEWLNKFTATHADFIVQCLKPVCIAECTMRGPQCKFPQLSAFATEEVAAFKEAWAIANNHIPHVLSATEWSLSEVKSRLFREVNQNDSNE